MPAARSAQARLVRSPGQHEPRPLLMTANNVTTELRDSTEAERPGAAKPTGTSTSTGPAGGEGVQLPPDALPILPIRNSILYPGVVVPLSIARQRSLAAIQY